MVVVLVLGCLLASLVGARAAYVPPQDGRPNVVVLMTDDMRAADLAYMPITRRLFQRRGVTFDNAVSTYPLCCPARAVLLSGQYNHNNGVEANYPPRGGMSAFDHSRSIATSMSRAGYATAFVGKFLNGYYKSENLTIHPPGWSTFVASAGTHVYDYWRPVMWVNGAEKQYPREYTTTQFTGFARRIARQWGGTDRPYFMWLAYVAPHTQCAPGWRNRRLGYGCWGAPGALPRDIRSSAGVRPVRSPSLDERDMSDKGRFMRDLPRLGAEGRQNAAMLHRYRVASLLAVDRSVGNVVRTLRRTGELDDTVLVFTSDNGFHLGEHRWKQKTLGYEESLHVPLLMAGPGLPRGVRVREPVAMVDVPATIDDLTGATPDRTPDGISLAHVARRAASGAAPRDRVLPIEAGPRDGQGDGWLYQGVRSARYTYFRWGTDGTEELYDRVRDPFQMDSVTRDPRYADILAWARDETARLRDCAGRGCVAWYDGPPAP